MAVQLVSATKVLKRTLSKGRSGRPKSSDYTRITTSTVDVPKGHLTVYVGLTSCKTRMVIPVSYLNHPLFKDMLRRVEEEFGFEHPMGGITVPCTEDYFMSLISIIQC